MACLFIPANGHKKSQAVWLFLWLGRWSERQGENLTLCCTHYLLLILNLHTIADRDELQRSYSIMSIPFFDLFQSISRANSKYWLWLGMSEPKRIHSTGDSGVAIYFISFWKSSKFGYGVFHPSQKYASPSSFGSYGTEGTSYPLCFAVLFLELAKWVLRKDVQHWLFVCWFVIYLFECTCVSVKTGLQNGRSGVAFQHALFS